MRTVLAALAIALLLPTCQRAPHAQMTAKVIESGAFELGPGKAGTREVRFITHGHEIDAHVGSAFGFRFVLRNVADHPTVDLKTVVTHPPFPVKSGAIETRYALITTIPVTDGVASSVTGFRIDRAEEMAPGVWTFEHAYDGKVLITESFTIR